MKENENLIGYYSVIPATILYNKELKANEKLLYAIINSLINKEWYCFATNEYLAKKLGVHRKTVSNWITHLEEKKFIIREVIKDENQHVAKRKIYLNDMPYPLNNKSINKGVVLSLNTNSTNKLIETLELKQIKFDKGEKALFRKYSYYQVVNAYKNLFVQDIEYIDTIRDNILQNKNIDFYRSIFKIKPDIKTEQLYEKICCKCQVLFPKKVEN